MMPSACTKPDQKASAEAESPMKRCLDIVEKKVRNLEKKKGKLDGYKQKKPEDLNPDQVDAISKYESVLQTLEVARELQKQFLQVSAEADKLLKKAARREKLERQQQEVTRVREILQLQGLLDNMGMDNVRADFKAGKNGALELSEDNLKQLDELYKLISPSREGETSFEEQLTAASEHIVNYLDSREKEVAGTTYKQLRELAARINESGYFEAQNTAEQETEEEAPEATQIAEEAPVSLETGNAPAPAPVEAASVPEMEELPTQASAPAETDTQVSAPAGFESSQSEYYSSDPGQFATQNRPFQEIVSSVQGNFNFLQDSEIELESHHMDPSVVAAHPIAGDAGYQSAALLSSTADNTYRQQALAQDPANTQTDTLTADSQYLDQSNPAGQTAGYDATAYPSTQSYDQNLMTQTLSTTTPHSYVDQASTLAAQMSQMEMSSSGAVPQPIPLPNQGLQAESYEGQQSQDSQKTFTMNPNADVFRSIYHQESSLSGEGQAPTGVSYTQENKSFSSAIQNDFQGSGNFGGAGSFGKPQQDGYQKVGGSRDMSGNRGRGGMSNGYRGNQQRGGQAGNYRGSRGGYSNGNSRGGRGGSTYTGYPPRGDYRPEGYQGFNTSFTSGFSGGKPRGATGRPAPEGGMRRGGPPRGGNGGGMNRGRGSYSRPNAPQQAAQ